MDTTTFITIHDLTDEARILYSSDSIVDILGYTPDEVVNRSVWDWFHPDEVPLAKEKHSRGVRLDKAAVLAYARILNRQGYYVGCECCFSVVYDVMVCCTSIYRRDAGSEKRAAEAPLVRRMFASSPKDPRYHMLSHLSSKFSLGDAEQTHEPRAALFLNRFTRSLTIMYATSGIEEIIGIPSEAMKGRSFYFCIQEDCLSDALRCLESAKGNDSIAYLRFRLRDPRRDDPPETPSGSEDDLMTDVTDSDDDGTEDDRDHHSRPSNSRTATGDSTHSTDSGVSVGNTSSSRHASTSSGAHGTPQSEARPEDIELEAVVSCTSDGLVVCLRRARPMMPQASQPAVEPTHQPTYQPTHQPTYQPTYPPAHHNIFAAPWAEEPVFQPALPRLPPYPFGAQHPAMVHPPHYESDFLQSIRDVAVFAWALTGINGCLAEYAKGTAQGESQPPDGFPVWAPEYPARGVVSSAPSGYVSRTSSRSDPFGDPGLS